MANDDKFALVHASPDGTFEHYEDGAGNFMVFMHPDDNVAHFAALRDATREQIEQATGMPLMRGEIGRIDDGLDTLRAQLLNQHRARQQLAEFDRQFKNVVRYGISHPEAYVEGIKPTETLAQRAERLRRLANKGRKRAW